MCNPGCRAVTKPVKGFVEMHMDLCLHPGRIYNFLIHPFEQGHLPHTWRCCIRTSGTSSWILAGLASRTARETCWQSFPASGQKQSQRCCSAAG